MYTAKFSCVCYQQCHSFLITVGVRVCRIFRMIEVQINESQLHVLFMLLQYRIAVTHSSSATYCARIISFQMVLYLIRKIHENSTIRKSPVIRYHRGGSSKTAKIKRLEMFTRSTVPEFKEEYPTPMHFHSAQGYILL